MDANGVAERKEAGSSDVGDAGGGIGRSRFLAAAGGALLGLGSGLIGGVESAAAATKYPGEIDKTLTAAEQEGAIIAIETELGTNPSGSAATVKAALEGKAPLTVFHLTAYGAVGDGTTDDAPKLREAFEDAAEVAEAGGVAIVQADGRKTYKLGSGTKGGAVPVPHNLEGRLEFHGEGCTFLFTSSVRHLFDCLEGSSKHDFIRNFLAQDFTVDAGEFHKVGLREHIVFGNQVEGSIQKYLRFENITLRRWTVVNGYTHGADGETETAMTGVYIRLKQEGNLGEEATQDVARNIVLEDWRMEGGLVGIDVGGESSKKVGSGEEEHSDLANVMIDEVYVENWYHSTGKAFSQGLNGSSIQIGHYCIGGTVTIRNGFSEYAGDVGVEIDFVEKCVVENVTVKDARNSCFLSPGMGKPLRGVGLQYLVDCRAIRERESGDCVGYLQAEGSGNSGNGAPQVHYTNCSFYSQRPQIDNADQAWFMRGASELLSLTNCRVEIVGLEQASEAEVEAPIVALGTTVNTTFKVRGLDLLVRGEDKHAKLKPIFLQLSGTAGVQRLLDVRGVTIRDELSGGGKNPRYTKVAVGPAEVLFRGFLEVAVLADGNSEESTAVYFFQGARINGRLNVTVDAKGMDNAKSKTFTFNSEFPEEQRARVRFVNTNFKEAPAKAAITVGASPAEFWNVDGYAELVAVRGGTVSKIELNGVEVGVTAGIFPVEPGDKLLVTYGGKPTMEKLPVP